MKKKLHLASGLNQVSPNNHWKIWRETQLLFLLKTHLNDQSSEFKVALYNRAVQDVFLGTDMNSLIIRKINGCYSGVKVLKINKGTLFRGLEVAQVLKEEISFSEKQIENGWDEMSHPIKNTGKEDWKKKSGKEDKETRIVFGSKAVTQFRNSKMAGRLGRILQIHTNLG